MYSVTFTASAAPVVGGKQPLFLRFNHRFCPKERSLMQWLLHHVRACLGMWTDPYRIYEVTPFLPRGNTDCLLTARFSSTFHPGLPTGSQRHHLCLPSAPPASGLVVLPAPASAVSPVSLAASFPSISSSLLSLGRRTAPGVTPRRYRLSPRVCPAFLTLLLPAPPVHLPVLNLRGTARVTARLPSEPDPRHPPGSPQGRGLAPPAHLRALGPLPHAALRVRHLPRAPGHAPALLIGRRAQTPPAAGRSLGSRGRCFERPALAAELSRVGRVPREDGRP